MEQYAELKTSKESVAKLVAELDKHYAFISTTPEQYRREQEDFYDGIFYAAGILFSATRDKQGKHHIKPYPMD